MHPPNRPSLRMESSFSATLTFAVLLLALGSITSRLLAHAHDPPVRTTLLRTDWRHANLSPLAHHFSIAQHAQIGAGPCASVRFAAFRFPLNAGLGSNLHVWAHALCHATARGEVLLSQGQRWLWRATKWCGERGAGTLLECYFGRETRCKLPHVPPLVRLDFWERDAPGVVNVQEACDTSGMPVGSVMRAGIELLFSNLPDQVVSRASAAASRVYGSDGAPRDLVSVHMRWGDKWRESALLPAAAYVCAVHALRSHYRLAHDLTVFLTTEDPAALRAFRRVAPPSWHVVHYAPAVGQGDAWNPMRTHLDNSTHAPMHDALRSRGKSGLESLVALLLTLEARLFVLHSGSNWGRLIDELRLARLERQCGASSPNCTMPLMGVLSAGDHGRTGHACSCSDTIDLSQPLVRDRVCSTCAEATHGAVASVRPETAASRRSKMRGCSP